MTLSDFGAAVALDALASVLDGGRIELLDADGAVLAAVTLAVPAFRPAEHGEAEAHVTLDGKEITAGPVAHQAPGELVFPPELVVPHAEVTIDRFLLRLRGVA